MTYALYERRGRIGVVTLNRPDRLNAISHALTADFEVALAKAFADEEALAIVLTGAGTSFLLGRGLEGVDQDRQSGGHSRSYCFDATDNPADVRIEQAGHRRNAWLWVGGGFSNGRSTADLIVQL